MPGPKGKKMARPGADLLHRVSSEPGPSATRQRRKSSLAAAQKMQAYVEEQSQGLDSGSDENAVDKFPRRRVGGTSAKQVPTKRIQRRKSDDSSEEYREEQEEKVAASNEQVDNSDSDPGTRGQNVAGQKKRKVTSRRSATAPFAIDGTVILEPCAPPQRRHSRTYHRPLLLHGRQGQLARNGLLAWFDSVAASRQMPWRKTWINAADYDDNGELRRALEKRAYEVWISEIMLQQTRVAVVIDYWNKWTAKWPTIQDLARAEPDDVLSAWRGLGYYSRATRIHEAAKKVVNDGQMRGLLPVSAGELEAKVPGVGRYTAGAISSIVFGRAAPMVDGNVLRVLSRQLGLYGNVKSNKSVIDALWLTADRLVKAVADEALGNAPDTSSHSTECTPSDRPGRWGQALMELGSTLCTPKPDCTVCPIQSTCRAFAEGRVLAGVEATASQAPVIDIEDICDLCEPFAEDEPDAEVSISGSAKSVQTSSNKQATLASFAFTKRNGTAKQNAASKTKRDEKVSLSSREVDTIIEHAKKFPLKVVKKAVREEETLVCAILRESDGHYLIQRRPEKGLLAGMWEFPSHTLPEASEIRSKQRKQDAQAFTQSLFDAAHSTKNTVRHVAELGSVPWLFSHLKLTMHVHLFVLPSKGKDDAKKGLVNTALCETPVRWASDADVERESMGTGMRKCWALIRAAKA